jgi:hypothetical protein
MFILLSVIVDHCIAFAFLPWDKSLSGRCRCIHLFSLADRHRIESPVALADITLILPLDWKQDNLWYKNAATILKKYGLVALESSNNEGLIKHEICDSANHAAFNRVRELQKRIDSRGIDPNGLDQPYRFAEIVCRDDGGRSVPLPWLGDDSKSDDIGTPLSSNDRELFRPLHKSIADIVELVTNSMWGVGENTADIAAAGFLMNTPGSQSQNWHRDGPSEGYIDCFVPLIDLDESVGPTAIQPGTHNNPCVREDGKENGVLVPILKKGDILLFDYRTIHRGLGNRSESITRTLAYAVASRKVEGACNSLGDIHNFLSALTLEFD